MFLCEFGCYKSTLGQMEKMKIYPTPHSIEFAKLKTLKLIKLITTIQSFTLANKGQKHDDQLQNTHVKIILPLDISIITSKYYIKLFISQLFIILNN